MRSLGQECNKWSGLLLCYQYYLYVTIRANLGGCDPIPHLPVPNCTSASPNTSYQDYLYVTIRANLGM